MKRFLHTLAALWPERRGEGSPPLPDTRIGILQHGAAVLRMDRLLSECVDSPIRKFAKETAGAAAPGDFVCSDGGPKYANTQIRESAAKSESAPQPNNLSHIRRPMPLLTIVIPVIFMCLMAAKQVSAQAEPAAAAAIKPLQIGDTIPEELWHLPLQVVNHPEGKETITLNDYRGKVILLDFLSTGCSGCIAAIPKIETVKEECGPDVIILPVTSQKRDRVAAFLPNNKHVNNTKLAFVVEDHTLKGYFPHLYISHVVWVDPLGYIRATTGTNHITAGTIREFITGDVLDWPVKTEATSFFNDPLVTLNDEANELPNNAKRQLYYSVITGFTEGVGPYVASKEDSLMGIERISFRNRSVLDLYRIAMAESFPTTHIIWEVKDPIHYGAWDEQSTNMTKEQWSQRYAMSYERTIPVDTPKKTWQKLMLDDLNNLLQLDGKIETRNGERYFVLSNR